MLWHPKSPALPKAPSQIRTQPAEFQRRENTPRRKAADNRKKLHFLQLWHRAFAQKRLWGSRSALASKKPLLTKGRKPKPRIPLWHLKKPALLKATSPRIPLTLNSVIRMPASNKESTAYGGPGALWHLKSPALPKAPSQSPEFSLR